MAKPLGDQDGPCRGLPGWTLLFLTDVYRAYGFSAAMLICLAGILVTLGIGILIAHAAEFYVKRSDLAEEGNRVADLLDGLRLAGNPVVDAQTIVNTWYENQPNNKRLRVVTKTGMYARLREAVRRGWIQCSNFPAHEVRHNFDCEITSVVRFFRQRRWAEINADEDR